MGRLSALVGERIYLDTNVFVYAVEGHPVFRAALRALFQDAEQGRIRVVTSELTLAEVLVKPMMDENLVRQRAYEQALRPSQDLEVVPVSRGVLREAARIRAVQRAKLADAIHIATAERAKCSLFLTNDRRLTSTAEMETILLSSLVDE